MSDTHFFYNLFAPEGTLTQKYVEKSQYSVSDRDNRQKEGVVKLVAINRKKDE